MNSIGCYLIYPNPSKGVFTISLDEDGGYDLTISNILGQPIYVSTIYGIEKTIDLSSFDKGVYTIELSNINNTFTKKVIVEWYVVNIFKPKTHSMSGFLV